jgi:hypothetical protein
MTWEEFRPKRWILTKQQQNDNTKKTEEKNEDDDPDINSAPDTAPTMFRSTKGAYIPFNEGFRACTG